MLGTLPGMTAPDHLVTTTRGTWKQIDGQLALTQPFWFGDSWWLPADPVAAIDNGLVRVRILPRERVDLSIMARATVMNPDNLYDVDGYGLSIAGDSLQLHRWERGVVRSVSEKVEVPGLTARGSIEAVFVLGGPVLTGFVYDGETLEALGSVSGIDHGGPTTGTAGLRAFRKNSAKTRILSFSVLDEAAAAEPAPDAPDFFGARRDVVVATSDLAKLPSELQKTRVRFDVTDERGTWTALELDPAMYERLRRTGVAIRAASHRLPWRWEDPAYTEWREKPVPRTARGFDLTKSYKNPEMVEAILKGYAKKYPKITQLLEIGTTHQGRTIWGLKISDNAQRDENEPPMALFGAHHGEELLAIDYTLDAIQVLLESYGTDPKVTRWVDELEIWAVPLVNPDGAHMFLEISQAGGRRNGRDTDENGEWGPFDGVDLNRNYPFRWGALGELGSRSAIRHPWYRGETAGSEPETQAMMALNDRHRFAGLISYHTNSTVLISPYTIDKVKNPSPDIAGQVGQAIVKALPKQPNGRYFKLVRKIYSVDGTDQDWHYFTHGTLAYIFEGSHHNPERNPVRLASIRASRPAFGAMFDRFLDGPSVSGRVLNRKGEPIEAVVEIDAITVNEGELWTSRSRDGRFDRFLPGPGTYTVTARAVGYKPVSEVIEIGAEHVEIELRFRRKAK